MIPKRIPRARKQLLPLKPKKSKFHNIRTTTPDGLTHASKKEAARWVFLLELQAKGVICDLRRQIRYPLHVNGVKIGTYIADHQFVWEATGIPQVEDVKSVRTAKLPLFRRNKKHMWAEYGIDVIEVFEVGSSA